MGVVFGKVVKVDAISGKILAIEDQFCLKPFPCEQEPCDIGSWVQKLKLVSMSNDFEVLDLRPEIKICAL